VSVLPDTAAFQISAGAAETVLKSAGLPATTVTKLRRLFEDVDRVIGYVSAIETSESDIVHKRIHGRDKGANKVITEFKFPPNKEKFEKEIERAQNHGLQVIVNFKKNDDGDNVIISISVVQPEPKWF